MGGVAVVVDGGKVGIGRVAIVPLRNDCEYLSEWLFVRVAVGRPGGSLGGWQHVWVAEVVVPLVDTVFLMWVPVGANEGSGGGLVEGLVMASWRAACFVYRGHWILWRPFMMASGCWGRWEADGWWR